MVRVQCRNHIENEAYDCMYDWIFTPRKRSYELKKSYWVRCPECKQKVFLRKKTNVLEAKR